MNKHLFQNTQEPGLGTPLWDKQLKSPQAEEHAKSRSPTWVP